VKHLVFLFCICISLFGQENSISLTSEEKKFLQNHPDITFGVDATWAPYVFVKDGKVVDGYEYEIIQKINSILGTNITIVPGVWNDIVTKAKNKKFYGLSVSIASKKRAQYFEFTHPSVVIRNNIMVRDGNPKNIHSLSDLQGKVIAIQKNNGFQKKRVQNIEGAKIIEFNDYKNFNSFLKENHVDAIPMSDASLYTLKSLEIAFNEILYLEDDKAAKIVFSIHKDYKILTNIINKALNAIPLEEKVHLRKKWLFSPIIHKNTAHEMIILSDKEKEFLHKKPRITIGIPQELISQKEEINDLSIEAANSIYTISGLRIDFKIASRYALIEDMQKKKIEGIVRSKNICQKNSNFLCSTPFVYDLNGSYTFTIREEMKEIFSIINRSLYSSYIALNDKSFLTQEDKKYLFINNTIRFCIDPFSPPLEELREGEYIGVGADTLRLLSKSMNISFELIKTKNWSESLLFMQENRCDIVPLAGKSEDRLNYMNFSNLIYEYVVVFVTKNNISFINDIKDLENKKIGVRKDYALYETIQKKYPNLTIVAVETNEEGMKQVKNGTLFALLGSVPSLGNLIHEHYLGELKISGKIDDKVSLFMGVSKDKERLVDILNKSLHNIPSSTRQNITTKWSSFIYEDNLHYVTILKIVIVVLCLIFVILFFFIYRQYLLKKYNINLKEVLKKEQIKNKIQTSKLLHQSKFAQVGEMTNIIAHQWRQPLSAISATANNLVFKLTLEDKIKKEKILEEVELISRYSQHLSNTINDFRSFFKSDKEPTEEKLEQLIDNVVKIIEPTLKEHNIMLEINSIKDVSYKICKNELQQAILGIIQNAKDAILEHDRSNGKITISLIKIQKAVEIKIVNNGGEIDNAIIDKIWEPYFTTKNDTGGTGIGLYISKMIVESHCKGKLTVENIKDGASFKITLPFL